MQMSQLRPASDCARQYGVKALAYGGPGSGKTPICNTAPRPVMLATEPGLLSMRDSNIPVWEAYTPERIDEFFAWFFSSNEVTQFDTLCVDSASQVAETFLKRGLIKNKHGMAAYGDMSRATYDVLEKLYYTQEKHIYLVCKQQITDEGGGLQKKRPYFPGKELNVKVPHLYDEILHVGVMQIPGVAGQQRAIRTLETLDTTARDRSGRLNECEPCDLTALFTKCMS